MELAKKILILDGQAEFSVTLKQMLAQKGYETSFADGHDEALDVRSTDQDVDMVLVDMDLRGAEDMALLDSYLRKYADIPVVLVSKYTNGNLILEALRQGATDYLIKPVEIQQLEMAIERAGKLWYDRRQGTEIRKFVEHMELHLLFNSNSLCLAKLQQMVQDTCQNYTQLSRKSLLEISLALEESVLNAHEHGNLELQSEWKEEISAGESATRFEQTKAERLRIPQFSHRKVEVQLDINREEVRVSVEDEGRGFQPGEIGNEATGNPYGMGLMLMNNLMDKISFNEKGNRITFVKQLSEKV